jgi:hypothetical protein
VQKKHQAPGLADAAKDSPPTFGVPPVGRARNSLFNNCTPFGADQFGGF